MGFNFKLLLVFLAACYSFSQLFFGLDYTDSFYYLDIFKSDEIEWMIIGFQLLGKLWINCFGDTLMALRIGNWLFYAISFLFAYLWFVPKENHKRYLTFLALPFLLLPTFSLNMFNGDSCTLLMCICISKLLADWIFNYSKKVTLMLFAVMLITFLFRFPNIVILPITILIVLLFQKNNRKWIEYIIVCFCVLIVYYGIVRFFITGNVISDDGTHSIKSLLYNYLRDGKIILQYIPVCLLLIAVSCAKINKSFVRICVDVLFTLFLLVYLFYNVELGFACWNISLFISSILISTYIYLIYKLAVESDSNTLLNKELLYLIILPLVAFVNPAGSDTGFLKLIWVLLSTVPFIAYNIDKVVQSKVIVVIMSVCIALCLYGHYKNPFGEKSLNKLTYKIDNKQLVGIRTNKEYYDVYNNLNDDIQNYKNDNVIVYGERSHGLCELLKIEKLFNSSFFMNPDEESEIEVVSNCITKYSPVVFFMPYNPMGAKEIFEWREGVTKMEMMMVSKGYIEKKRTDYYIVYEMNK